MWRRVPPYPGARAARAPRLSLRGSGDRGPVGQKPERLLRLRPPSKVGAQAGEDVRVCHNCRSPGHGRVGDGR